MRGVALRLSFAQAASGAIGGAYTPFFGAWLAWKGLAPDQIGALLSAGMLLRVVVAPVTGIIADAKNDRRGMMLFLYAIMLAGYGALNGVSWPYLIFLAAIPANIAGGSITPLLESVSVRLSERFDFDYGHVRVWCSTLFVAGNLCSGALVSLWGMGVIAPWLAVSVLLSLISIYALPKPRPDAPRGELRLRMRATLAEARELSRSPVFLIFLAAASLDQGSEHPLARAVLARAAAEVVNGGRAITPTFLRHPADARGRQLISPQPSPPRRRRLRYVATNGTGRKADVPGYDVGGKTGSAQVPGPNGHYARDKLVTSFCAIFPDDHPRYLVFVVLDEPHGTKKTFGIALAGFTAAPLAGHVIARIAPLLGVPPEPAPVLTVAKENS